MAKSFGRLKCNIFSLVPKETKLLCRFIFFVSKNLLFWKHLPCECRSASWAFKPIRHGPISHVLKNVEKVHYYVKKCNKQYSPGLKIIIVAGFPILGIMLVQLTFYHLTPMLWTYYHLSQTALIDKQLIQIHSPISNNFLMWKWKAQTFQACPFKFRYVYEKFPST